MPFADTRLHLGVYGPWRPNTTEASCILENDDYDKQMQLVTAARLHVRHGPMAVEHLTFAGRQ